MSGVLASRLRGLGDDVAQITLSPVAGALRPLLPEIADLLPPAPLEDRIAERHRVFRGLVEVLALGPSVVVLEDLHWADELTAEFVSYLLADQPAGLAVVLTFRSDEVGAGVRALAAKLPTATGRTDIALAPLDERDTGQLAAAILGVERISQEFGAYLCERDTAGTVGLRLRATDTDGNTVDQTIPVAYGLR